MISILIPIYNCKVIGLVKTLKEQAEKLSMEYEIICLDDVSSPKYRRANDELHHYFKVNYVELSEKLGRSKIRNWMVKLSKYDNLIFLDADTKIINKKFLKNYIKHLGNYSILYGGRIYQDRPPRTGAKMLHWKYGRKVESKSAQERNKAPYLSFLSNNFMVTRSVITRFPFDECITGYGFEDLALAYQLYLAGIPVLHIDNPTLHTGIEYTRDMLPKTERAISNLIELHHSGKVFETRLIRTYRLLKKTRLDNLIYRYLKKKEPSILHNLKSENPSVQMYQWWKLLVFMKKIKKGKTSEGGLS